MKNKKSYLVTFELPLFKEKFLINKEDKGNPAEAAPASSPEATEITKKETLLFEKLNAALKPAQALKFERAKNPYAVQLDKKVKTLPDLTSITFDQAEKKDGKLVLKYDGKTKELVFEGDEYKAIFWGEISGNLDVLFKGKNVSTELVAIGIENGKEAPKLAQLIDEIAKDPTKVKETDTLVAEALGELEKLRPKLNLGGKRERTLLGSEIEQNKARMLVELRKNEPQLPTSAKLNKSQFLAQRTTAEKDLDEGPDKLNITRRGILRDQLGINPRDWDVTTQNSLNKVFIQWRYLGINVDGDPFYQTMFFILKDRLTKRLSLVDDQKRLFEDPENHVNEIEKIDEEYAIAFRHFLAVKTKIRKEVTDSEKVADLQEGKGGLDKVMGTATDALKKNYNEFARSIRERDYATAGVYLLGIYALYKTYSSLTEGVDGAKYKKYMFYAIAAGAGYVFARNAGYDVLKMAGFKYKDAEIAGTSLDIITTSGLKEAENLNSAIVLKLAKVRVKDLSEMYTAAEAKDDKVKIIPPDKFPQLFPDLVGKSGTKEYTKTGHDIFLAVAALKAVYRNTLERKTGLTFEEACKKDPILEMATVENLCAQMDLYSPGRNAPALLDFKKFEKAKTALGKAFDSTGKLCKFDINRPDENGVMNAIVLNFPVVVVFNAAHERYRFYYKNVFKDGKSGEESFGEISETGADSKTEAGSILDKINEKMDNLTAELVKNRYSKPQFDGRDWVATKDLDAQPTLGLPKETETFIVNPNHDGTALSVEMKRANISVMMDEGLVNKSPDSLRLLLALLGGKNPKFRILSPFAAAKMISINDIDAKKGTFGVFINEVKESFTIKYDTASGAYDFVDPKKEQDLLKNKEFKYKLIELSTQDPKILDGVSRFKGLLDQAPESYLMNFVRNVPKWVTGAKSGSWFEGVKLRHLTGSIAKDYTKALLDAQMAFMKSKMIVATEGTTNFTDAAMKIENVKSAFENQLSNIVNEFTRLVNKKENIPEDEYNSKVFDKINSIGAVSAQYKHWYSKFVGFVMDNLGGDDLRHENAKKAGKIIGAFAYYTAPIDDFSLDGVDLKATGSPGTDDYVVKAKYINYVVNQIDDRLVNEPENLPNSPEAWRLLKFEEFKKNPFASPELLARTRVYKATGDYPKFDVAKPNPDAIFRDAVMPTGMDATQLNAWVNAVSKTTEIEEEITERYLKVVESLVQNNLNNLVEDNLQLGAVNNRKEGINQISCINMGGKDYFLPKMKTEFINAYLANPSAPGTVTFGLTSLASDNVSGKLASYGRTIDQDLQDSIINDEVKSLIDFTILSQTDCWMKNSIPRKMKAWWDGFKFSSLFD